MPRITCSKTDCTTFFTRDEDSGVILCDVHEEERKKQLKNAIIPDKIPWYNFPIEDQVKEDDEDNVLEIFTNG